MPSYPRPSDVPVVPDDGPRKSFPFYANVEERQMGLPGENPGERVRVDMALGPDAKPEWTAWYRFRPSSKFNDSTLDCARALILLDALVLNSCIMGHPKKLCLAATTQTDVLFCGPPEAHDTDWLLADLRCPFSYGGMMWSSGAVWSEGGRLLALGQSKMMFRGDVMDR